METEQGRQVKDREQEEAWVEVADEAEWVAIARAQAPEEFVYALNAIYRYRIK